MLSPEVVFGRTALALKPQLAPEARPVSEALHPALKLDTPVSARVAMPQLAPSPAFAPGPVSASAIPGERAAPPSTRRRADPEMREPAEREPRMREPTEREARKTREPVELEAKTQSQDDGQTRVRLAVPDPRSAMIERWIAGREGPVALLVDDTVLLCAALAPPVLERFLPGQLEFRVQLHRLPSYPLVTLTVVAPAGESGRNRGDAERVLTVPLDIGRAAHRVVLDALSHKAALALELFDAEYLRVVSHRVEAPLEENVRRVSAEAKDAFERLSPSARNFERACAMLFHASYDWLGRTVVELPEVDTVSLERPSGVRAALATVARWSEPGAEAYLVEIRSLPISQNGARCD